MGYGLFNLLAHEFSFPSRISYTHCFLTWDGVSGGFTYQLGNPILPGKILIDYND